MWSGWERREARKDETERISLAGSPKMPDRARDDSLKPERERLGLGKGKVYSNDDSVKIYTYKWEPAQPAGIENISISHNADNCYSIDGRKLSGKPAQKGIYIVNGRKVAVK